jgi:(R,R)-butanediol dehydrogenase/meso-butanediol dehydrogenase/diacetyl reductase
VGGLREGERVVIAVPPACGRCPECRGGVTEHCRSTSLVARGRDDLAPPHGGFARSITVQADRLLPAHPDLTDEEAAQVEPATVAFHAVRRSRITPGDTVVVQGAGPIGLLALQFARVAGAGRVLVVERSEGRRRLAVELGASVAVAPDQAADAVLEHTRGLGADVALECAGVPSLLQTAADLTRTGGVVGLLSFLARPAAIDGARWLAKELTLVASNAFTHDDFRRSMAFLADGRVEVAPLHSRTVGLGELEPTLRALSAGVSDDVKVLVDPRRGSADGRG